MTITERKDDGICIIALSGELDIGTSDDARDRLLAAVDAGERSLAVDFREVDYISSSGLRIFILVLKKLNSLNGRLVLFGVQEKVAQVFRLAGFSRLFSILENEEEAVATLKKA